MSRKHIQLQSEVQNGSVANDQLILYAAAGLYGFAAKTSTSSLDGHIDIRRYHPRKKHQEFHLKAKKDDRECFDERSLAELDGAR